MINSKRIFPALMIFSMVLLSCGPKFTEENNGDIIIVKNESGKVLGYHPDSGVSLLTEDRYAFKDLNKNGELDPMKTGVYPQKKELSISLQKCHWSRSPD